MGEDTRRRRILQEYVQEEQPDTRRFPTLQQAPQVQVIPVEKPTCAEHRECEQRIRSLEMWRALVEQWLKPVRILVAAALGGVGVGIAAWLLGHFGK
jgi:pyruvate dehydrogenase complex dehydrogenase (E1) component